MENSENKKYKTGTKIHIYKLGNAGRWTNYQYALHEDEIDLLTFASSIGYVCLENDSKKGGKSGVHFLVKKYFTTNSMRKRLLKITKERQKKLDAVLTTEEINNFRIISNIGSVKIDSAYYSNFYGNGSNAVSVVKCNESQFKNAKFLSRREVFNSEEPITIVKFPIAKTISISKCDCDDSFGSVEIKHSLGFVIWKRMVKIFVK